MKPIPAPFATEQLTQALQHLGIQPGDLLLVHTSLKNVGWVAAGPVGVIAALRSVLGNAGTLVMPTMTDSELLFDPQTTPTAGMGIVAEMFWRQPGVLRSGHPTGSFAAQGPLAAMITAPQPLDPPHGLDSPIGRVYAHDGWILLLGVEHDSNTTIHLAENISNVPYRRIKQLRVPTATGEQLVTIAETDHCCQNFPKIAPHLLARDQLIIGQVGYATAQLMRSRAVVQLACELIAQDPYYFLCPPGQCQLGSECDEARAYHQ